MANHSKQDYYLVEESVRKQTTTCDMYIFTYPCKMEWDPKRLELPPLIVEFWDLETKGLDATKDEFQFLTSTSIYCQINSTESSPPQILDVECITWQESQQIPGITIHFENSEEQALTKIVQRRREQKVDIVVTYNGIKFDMVVLCQRIEKLQLDSGLDAYLGKDLTQKSHVNRKGIGEDAEIMGVIHHRSRAHRRSHIL